MLAVLSFAPLLIPAAEPIDPATMQRVHDEVKTPFKPGQPGKLTLTAEADGLKAGECVIRGVKP